MPWSPSTGSRASLRNPLAGNHGGTTLDDEDTGRRARWRRGHPVRRRSHSRPRRRLRLRSRGHWPGGSAHSPVRRQRCSVDRPGRKQSRPRRRPARPRLRRTGALSGSYRGRAGVGAGAGGPGLAAHRPARVSESRKPFGAGRRSSPRGGGRWAPRRVAGDRRASRGGRGRGRWGVRENRALSLPPRASGRRGRRRRAGGCRRRLVAGAETGAHETRRSGGDGQEDRGNRLPIRGPRGSDGDRHGHPMARSR